MARLLGGIAIVALFVVRERSSDHPILDVSLFRNPTFSAASAAITLNFFALFGAMFYLTFYLQFVRGYDPLQAGVRMLPVALAMAIFAPRSPVFVRRFGAKAVCAAGMLLVTAAFLMYQLLGQDTSIWVLEVLLFVQGVGMANVFAPATESIMSTLPRARAGAGSAVNNTVRQVGGALGVAIIGSILSAAYRHGIDGSLTGLPPAAAHAAGESIGATNAVVAQASAHGLDMSAVSAAANSAFIDAMHVASIVSAAVAFLGVLVVLKWLPSRAPVQVDEPDAELPAAPASGARRQSRRAHWYERPIVAKSRRARARAAAQRGIRHLDHRGDPRAARRRGRTRACRWTRSPPAPAWARRRSTGAGPPRTR